MSRRRPSVRRRPGLAATLWLAVAVATISVVSGCGGRSGSITVTDPWARPSPPGTDSTAIYVVLRNETVDDHRLVAVETDRCGQIELHRTEIAEDGVASMVPAAEGDLAFGPGEELAFEPNALHVMCIGIPEPFLVGESFDIELAFADGESLTVAVPVRRP